MTTTKKQVVQVPLADFELAIATEIIREAAITDDLRCNPRIQLEQGTLRFLFDVIGPQTFAAYCSREATLEELLKHIHEPTLLPNRNESVRIAVTVETSGNSLFQQRNDSGSFLELLERTRAEKKEAKERERGRIAEAQELLQSKDSVHQCVGRLLMYLINFYPGLDTFGYTSLIFGYSLFKRGIILERVSSEIAMRTIKQGDLWSSGERWLESAHGVSWEEFREFLLAKNREFEVVQILRERENSNPDPDIEAILGDHLHTALLWKD